MEARLFSAVDMQFLLRKEQGKVKRQFEKSSGVNYISMDFYHSSHFSKSGQNKHKCY